jgi:hypothetical protein
MVAAVLENPALLAKLSEVMGPVAFCVPLFSPVGVTFMFADAGLLGRLPALASSRANLRYLRGTFRECRS